MVTKSYACSNKPVAESFCWNICCFLLQQEIDWHIFNCHLVAVVGTSRNMTFKFRRTFIFYSEKIRRILKFAFISFVVYVNLKLLFRYFFMQKKCWHIKGCSRTYTCNLELSLCWQRCQKTIGTTGTIVWVRAKHYFYWLLVINEINTYVHLELKVLGNWAQANISHLYWAIFTCNKNGKELIKKHTSPKHILQGMRSSTT